MSIAEDQNGTKSSWRNTLSNVLAILAIIIALWALTTVLGNTQADAETTVINTVGEQGIQGE
ncbi:MAG: hypothetical protein ACOVMD_05085, partial [Aquiluna sp.]